ncbi:hypothetical protein NBRC10512_001126 [Rhodotorula toruloides]|uniref:RHTO0S06e12002g1_1 n=2 Tax=Rhodotorula toruloides TaxID=5286 RepID=A0A061B5G7_RHOTO|nr:uncharacterized protein RHTO_06650 [Rhodotorula toruloides NP11]EMS18156.1 hypothetical protein RHTO_06650 [Rhodotorula toruloides NP11]CDR42268.1 RHTO0S06e12002g1_1 [Rhodotorula toruloides]
MPAHKHPRRAHKSAPMLDSSSSDASDASDAYNSPTATTSSKRTRKVVNKTEGADSDDEATDWKDERLEKQAELWVLGLSQRDAFEAVEREAEKALRESDDGGPSSDSSLASLPDDDSSDAGDDEAEASTSARRPGGASKLATTSARSTQSSSSARPLRPPATRAKAVPMTAIPQTSTRSLRPKTVKTITKAKKPKTSQKRTQKTIERVVVPINKARQQADQAAQDPLLAFFRPGPWRAGRLRIWHDFLNEVASGYVSPTELNNTFLRHVHEAAADELALDLDPLLDEDSWSPDAFFGKDPIDTTDLLEQLEQEIAEQESEDVCEREPRMVDMILEMCVLPGGPTLAAKNSHGKWRSHGPTADHEHVCKEELEQNNGGTKVVLHDLHFSRCAGAYKRACYREQTGQEPTENLTAPASLLRFQYQRFKALAQSLFSTYRIAFRNIFGHSSDVRGAFGLDKILKDEPTVFGVETFEFGYACRIFNFHHSTLAERSLNSAIKSALLLKKTIAMSLTVLRLPVDFDGAPEPAVEEFPPGLLVSALYTLLASRLNEAKQARGGPGAAYEPFEVVAQRADLEFEDWYEEMWEKALALVEEKTWGGRRFAIPGASKNKGKGGLSPAHLLSIAAGREIRSNRSTRWGVVPAPVKKLILKYKLVEKPPARNDLVSMRAARSAMSEIYTPLRLKAQKAREEREAEALGLPPELYSVLWNRTHVGRGARKRNKPDRDWLEDIGIFGVDPSIFVTISKQSLPACMKSLLQTINNALPEDQQIKTTWRIVQGDAEGRRPDRYQPKLKVDYISAQHGYMIEADGLISTLLDNLGLVLEPVDEVWGSTELGEKLQALWKEILEVLGDELDCHTVASICGGRRYYGVNGQPAGRTFGLLVKTLLKSGLVICRRNICSEEISEALDEAS